MRLGTATQGEGRSGRPVIVARIARCERALSPRREAPAHLRPGAPLTQLLPAVWIALIAVVTLTVGTVPVPDTELGQLTPAVPDGPAACSGIEALLVLPEIPVVSIVATRVGDGGQRVSAQRNHLVMCYVSVTALPWEKSTPSTCVARNRAPLRRLLS